MIIKKLTPADLKQFVDSDEFKKLEIVPVSRHRAWSHIANPRLNESDVILYLAYNDDELIAYRCVLADKIITNTKELKIGWLSGNWVKPSHRRHGIASELLKAALKDWNNQLIYTNYAPESKAVYDKSGHFDLVSCKHGVRGYLRFNLHDLLAPKGQVFRRLNLLLKVCDSMLNAGNDLRLRCVKYFYRNPRIKFEYVNDFDPELQKFIEQKSRNQLTRRGVEELRWIIKNPWMLSMPIPDHYQHRYFFSAATNRFFTFNLKIYNPCHVLTGFLMIVLNGGKMSVPYCYFDKSNVAEIVTFIYRMMLETKADYLTVFNPDLTQFILHHHSPFVFKKKMERNYLATKKLIQELELSDLPDFQDGDGDPVFTG